MNIISKFILKKTNSKPLIYISSKAANRWIKHLNH